MKSKKIQLSISNPCSQDWNAMTTNERGKFCDHCAKSVIDLTKMSDQQIVQLISSNPGKICGRVRRSQLDRYMTTERTTSASSPYPFLAGLFIASSGSSIAAPAVQPKIEIVEPKTDQSNIETKKSVEDTLFAIIEGVVKDEISGEVLPGVVVKIRGTNLGTVSDIDGKFKFILPDTLSLSVIVIYSEYFEGEGNEVIMDRRKTPFLAEIIINTYDEIQMIGAISLPKKWWQFWR